MPSNTLIASAEMPAGPATFTCSPSVRFSLTAARYASTGSRMSEPCPVPVSWLAMSAVVPSGESS